MCFLPLIRKLKKEFSDDESPWYADDGVAAARLKNIDLFFKRLCELGPLFGYFPEGNKSILVVREKYLEKAEKIMGDNAVILK